MLQSFYTGNTGLGANRDWLSVISDNIANVNTNGYKQEVVNFNDLVSSSLTTFSAGGAPKNREIGGGSFVGSTTKDFSQGAFKNTNQPLSLALDGEGFFMVRSPSAKDLQYYTRDGNFRVDANGDIINQSGYKLQGWKLDNNGNMAGALGDVNIPNSLAPHMTSQVSFEEPTNLDSSVPVPANATFKPSDSSSYNYVNTIPAYDSLGNQHILYFYFVKSGSANNTWDVYSFLDIPDDNNIPPKHTLTFDTNGKLSGGANEQLSFTLTNGATSPLTIDVSYQNIKQVASDFIFYSQQDGYGKGDLMNISVSEDGVVKGSYTNGQVKDIARLGVATFKDKEILIRKGDNLYLPNQKTFTPIIVPGGVISKIRSGMLEMSNVDISKEFINLITAQRAYQANAKTITTSDQILQTTMDIKR
ncbi:flagellar hook protein FlgE [Nitratiruptor sp. YY08-26]|uniref:flagellar hook protein FlgE n=1 Tax=unclassified Nitratiruptor TaxID=2624044 RepID=UPI001916B73D|nr:MULTISPECIES: flagellar hook protein FlgE [unclassified Nitratiruptor]BCD61867.1 flagellar hook protein FlgE [Nitratiruptor sp. YY08-13]BCD65802.1 flagellar hook protein FlgE [Nitratiruptor sp. YY08-26]